ncbi:MAG TPA: hypothetical protein DEA96_08200 [Leptospiraceae bacterium]|nr:hypothetical protein [Spirochaetaceae bacterium]HBS04930.1 hypothetical protein [Leptospiraceae bacterium]|tara:strand:- start:10980 stop:12560 length:1581 start_codon:yes stop_codon:yes gene_type:complete
MFLRTTRLFSSNCEARGCPAILSVWQPGVIRGWILCLLAGSLLLLPGCQEEKLLESILPAIGSSPRIIAAYPPDNLKGLDPSRGIWLLFDQSMDTSQCERAFSLTGTRGEIQGAFVWQGRRRLEFVPDSELESGMHLLRVAASAESRHGLDLEQEYRSSFFPNEDARPPRLTGSDPMDGAQGVEPDSKISLHFSEALSIQSLHQGIQISPSAGFSIEFEDARSTVVLNPRADFVRGQSYTISLATSIEDLSGNQLPSSRKIAFVAGSDFQAPGLESITMGGKILSEGIVRSNISKSDSIVFEFTEAMSKPATENSIGISPSTDLSRTWESPTTLILEADQELQGETQYELTLSGGATDTSGNSMESPAIYPFFTDAEDSISPQVEIIQQARVDLPGDVDGASPIEQYFPEPQIPDYGIVDTAHVADLDEGPGLERAIVLRILFSRDMNLATLYEAMSFVPVINTGNSSLQVHRLQRGSEGNEILLLAAWTPAGYESSPVYALQISDRAEDSDGNRLSERFRRYLSF